MRKGEIERKEIIKEEIQKRRKIHYNDTKTNGCEERLEERN